jgi:ribosomal protein S18 acetylase RimI-like enzyme
MTDIIPALPEEAEALSRFAERAFRDTFAHLYDPADLAAFFTTWNPPERIRAQIADPAWAIRVARDADGAIAGFVKTGPIDFDLPPGQPAEGATELHQLYVGKDAKGTGVAPALMQSAIDWARERASILYLSVFVHNHRAQAFYRRYGFVDVGRNMFRVGNQLDEDRIWRLDL